MSLFRWQDLKNVPDEIKSHLMKYSPQAIEAGVDITSVRAGTMTRLNFEAKWGVSYVEVDGKIKMVRLVLDGAKASVLETKELWAWVILLLKRRAEGRSREHLEERK